MIHPPIFWMIAHCYDPRFVSFYLFLYFGLWFFFFVRAIQESGLFSLFSLSGKASQAGWSDGQGKQTHEDEDEDDEEFQLLSNVNPGLINPVYGC
jgi:hypothetical protein